MRKFLLLVCLGILTVHVLTETAAAQSAPERTSAPVLNQRARNAIPGQYIVVFKPSGSATEIRRGGSRDTGAIAQSQAAQRLAEQLGGKVRFTYASALVGFSAKLPANALEALRSAPGVDYIEADQMGSISTIEQLPFPAPFPAVFPNGLDRTSERLLPLDGRFTYSLTGTGVNVYVLDTGIRATHTDFGGRASGAVDEVMDGNGTNDCHGHGTHVAGTIGGTLYGIAKQVTIHAVRVAQCSGSVAGSAAIAGVDWVTANAVHPAVANMSLTFGVFASLDTAVTNSITSGVTYVVAAGNSNSDACNNSPARVPTAITVGAVDPTNDTRASFSNFGTCLDLFGPGVNILSDWNTNDTATNTISGTSMASPHVAGVAALWLQNHPGDSPAAVLAQIHNAADVAATPGWAGVVSPGTGSPNELLHWGSAQNPVTTVYDGFNDGDPHLVTVDGTHYNFQGGGEFVALRDAGGLEIQTRETPVQTSSSFLGPDPYDGIASCVSVNTAVAARVGGHRVTFQPNISGAPDPSGMQLRVDGILKALDAQGLNLGAGGRVVKSSIGNGVEIDFPDGTVLVVTANWWAGQSLWYLNVDVFHTPATAGLMGTIAPGSWLPALPSGASVGAMPATVPQRYVVLYQQFGNAWRVNNATSLFDYKPGTSTATFTVPSWPMQSPPCTVPQNAAPLAKPANASVAHEVCRAIENKTANADCVFDVTITGEEGFAKTYLMSQRLQAGATRTTVTDNLEGTLKKRRVFFTATVTQVASNGRGTPTGTVQFTVGGKKVGDPVRLNKNGQARWKTANLMVLDQDIVANYIPSADSEFLPSSGHAEAKRGSIE